MKALIGVIAGFAIAAAVFSLDSGAARALAYYVIWAGLCFGAFFVVAILAMLCSPSPITTAWLVTYVTTKLPAQSNKTRNAKRLRGAKKSDSKVTWSELPRVDYENYELPTYLRRGYDRRAL